MKNISKELIDKCLICNRVDGTHTDKCLKYQEKYFSKMTGEQFLAFLDIGQPK